MCVEHAAAIDIPETLSAYPAERLRDWKQKQLEQYSSIQQGWTLDADMAQEVIDASSRRADVMITNSAVSLAGEGGKGPGAGGGGGGAVGKGARGGRGGDGGDHRIDDGDYTLPWSAVKPAHLEMSESARLGVNSVPGAGGGGEGAIGDDARGGDGGNGGEHVSALIDIVKMRKDGLHHAEVVIGKGGESGCSGEDTILNFVTEDGKVLKAIRASGGDSGGSALPDGVLQVTQEDVHNNFRVTTFMTANALEVRDGLFFILGADWDNYTAPRLPFEAVWPVVFAVRWRSRQWSAPRGFFLSLLRPNGREAARQALVIPAASGPGGCFRWFHALNVKLDMEGTWTLHLQSGGFLLAQLDVPIAVLP